MMRSTFQLILFAVVAAFSLPLVMAAPSPGGVAVEEGGGVEQGIDVYCHYHDEAEILL